MTPDPEHLAQARKVADAVLYEGYLLYPYHQSSQKNQSRFQFGVLMPVAYAELDPSEPSASQTQCLVECADNAQVRITVRFLQLQRRGVEEAAGDGRDFRPVSTLTVDGQEFTAWDEAVEREEQLTVSVGELIGPALASTGLSLPFSFGPQTTQRGSHRRVRPAGGPDCQDRHDDLRPGQGKRRTRRGPVRRPAPDGQDRERLRPG